MNHVSPLMTIQSKNSPALLTMFHPLGKNKAILRKTLIDASISLNTKDRDVVLMRDVDGFMFQSLFQLACNNVVYDCMVHLDIMDGNIHAFDIYAKEQGDYEGGYLDDLRTEKTCVDHIRSKISGRFNESSPKAIFCH